MFYSPFGFQVQPVLRSAGSAGLPARDGCSLQTNQSLRETQGAAQPDAALGKHPRGTQEGRVNPAVSPATRGARDEGLGQTVF